jgi:methionine-rich copper-binding protein CopC
LAMSSPNRADNAIVPKIPLPPSALKTVLRLPAGATPETNYRSRLLTGDGTSTIIEIAERDEQTVTLVIPAAQLKRGSYAIKLLSISPDGTEQPLNGSYFFDIE